MNTRVIITLDDVEKMQYDPESIGIAVLRGLGFIDEVIWFCDAHECEDCPCF